MLRVRKKKEKQTTKFKFNFNFYSCNNSESSLIAPYCVIDSLQLSKRALGKD